MTPRERFLAAMRAGGVPDRVPCAPDFSNYIPCRRTGLPFWEVYFDGVVPLWKAYLDTVDYFGTEAWMASCTGVPFTYAPDRVETTVTQEYDRERDAMVQRSVVRTPDGDLTSRSLCYRADPPSPVEKPIKDIAVYCDNRLENNNQVDEKITGRRSCGRGNTDGSDAVLSAIREN